MSLNNNNIDNVDNNSLENEQNQIFRFIQDLEFVQCLANPKYLNYLAVNNYFEEKEFINYIKYLQYFKNDLRYTKFITYSNSLIFLDLLQYEFFRQLIKNGYSNILLNIINDDYYKKAIKYEEKKKNNLDNNNNNNDNNNDNNNNNIINNNNINNNNINNNNNEKIDINKMDLD